MLVARRIPALALGLALAGPALGADGPAVTLVGATGQERAVRVADLQALQPQEIAVTDPHGKEPARYRGVPLAAALALVGAPFGSGLKGPALAAHVQVEAADGYRVAFSLAELDPATGSTEAYLAFERDGKPLDAAIGPWRLVVPTDKRGARWARQVTRIRVVQP